MDQFGEWGVGLNKHRSVKVDGEFRREVLDSCGFMAAATVGQEDEWYGVLL